MAVTNAISKIPSELVCIFKYTIYSLDFAITLFIMGAQQLSQQQI